MDLLRKDGKPRANLIINYLFRPGVYFFGLGALIQLKPSGNRNDFYLRNNRRLAEGGAVGAKCAFGRQLQLTLAPSTNQPKRRIRAASNQRTRTSKMTF